MTGGRVGTHGAGLVGGAVSALAAGAAAGVAVQRLAIGRARLRPDPEAREPFGRLPGRSRIVRADDGVALHVEEVGDPAAPLTIVFCHGYANHSGLWHYQRRDLADLGRLVFWDVRGHGRSGWGDPEAATIDQLGRDLSAVLRAAAPSGPVVLVGHSMGGMTVMALADQQPELFGSKIIGVALLSTSTGRLAEVTFGLPAAFGSVSRLLLPVLRRGVKWRPAAVERGRRIGSDLAFLVTRRFSFASRRVSPTVVDVVERMIASTPVEVIADFYPAFHSHDKLAALGVLAGVETLILVGDRDVMTPPDHSREMAAAVPHAQLVVVPQAGHMVPLEHPALVNLQLRAFVRRAARGHPRHRLSVPVIRRLPVGDRVRRPPSPAGRHRPGRNRGRG